MPTPPSQNKIMSLGEHLDELRRRTVIALAGLVPLFVLAFVFGDRLLALLLQPLRDALISHGHSPVIRAIAPLETFGAYMKISFIAAVVVGSPWVIYQLWQFVAPGLYRHERRFAYVLVPMSTVLTAVGVFFLYTVVMPVVLSFFIEFGSSLGAPIVEQQPVPEGLVLSKVAVLEADPASPQVGDEWINTRLMMRRVCVALTADGPTIVSQELHPEIGVFQEYRISEYVRLLLSLMLAFAGAFQTPIVVLLLGWAGLINREILKKHRRHAVIVCAVIAAVVGPGDPTSMILLLGPLYVLYELGGVLLYFFPASKVKAVEGDDDSP